MHLSCADIIKYKGGGEGYARLVWAHLPRGKYTPAKKKKDGEFCFVRSKPEKGRGKKMC